MDQLKEILKQAIKYRFWIAVGVSALFSIIAYVVGSGPVKAKAEEETKKIKGADQGVKQYASGVAYNGQYRPIMDGKTSDLTLDVNASHRKLYARQAPLLTWPNPILQQKFQSWGKKWPEEVDSSVVQLTIINYVEAYPKFVTQVYNTFHPFDTMEGTGIVAAPPEDMLLRPAQFSRTDPPNDLAKIWSAQERLWVQRSLLQVIADVNKEAKDWDGAVVKQINAMDVGTQTAQDQISLAKGETLVKADPIVDPKAPPPETSDASGGAGMPGMESMMRGTMGGGGGGQKEATDEVFHIQTDATAQYQILPVQMTVLVDQTRVQDFLVALENSPLAIQLKEVEVQKPNSPVTKPKKGENMMFAGFGGGMMGMGMGMRMGGMNMSGMGGAMSMMMGRMGPSMGMTGRGGMMGMGMSPSMTGMMGMMGGGAATARKGVDRRSENREQARKDEEKAARERVVQALRDPYFNIIEVSIFGQARFYNAPTLEPAAEPSQSPGATTAEAPAPAAGAPAATEPAKTEAEPAKTEAAKTEAAAPGAEPAKTEAAKTEGAKPAAEAPKAEEGKTSPAPAPAPEKGAGEPAAKAAPEPTKPAGDAPKPKDESPKAEPAGAAKK